MQIAQGGDRMYLKIDGHEIQAQPGESLLNLVHKIGFCTHI